MKIIKNLLTGILCIVLSQKTYAQPLTISEILPNPKGKDQGNEWIELYNPSNQTIKNEDFIIEKNAKKIKLGQIEIPPHSFKVIYTTVKNSENKISLIGKGGEYLDSVKYTESKEGLSLSKSKIISEKSIKTAWIWTLPTKSQQNKEFQELIGIIKLPPQIFKEYYFEIIDEAKNTHRIEFTEDLHDFSELSQKLTKDTEVKLLLEKQADKNILMDYKIKNSLSSEKQNNIQTTKEPAKTERWQLYTLLTITTTTFLLYFLSRKKITNRPNSTTTPYNTSHHKPSERTQLD